MSELDERQIVDFLQQNHDFLQKHPELLTRLSIFDEPQGTTSLVRRQQNLLQNKNRELTTKLSALLENAATNEHIFKVFNQCHRILLEVQTFDELNKRLSNTICKGFNLLDCKLIRYDSDKHQALVTERLTESTFFLGRLSQNEQLLLFSQAAPSAAVYLLRDDNTPSAILAFASKDEMHYHPEQNSSFVLEFIKALTIKLNQL